MSYPSPRHAKRPRHGLPRSGTMNAAYVTLVLGICLALVMVLTSFVLPSEAAGTPTRVKADLVQTTAAVTTPPSTSAAVRYHWGTPVARDEFNSKAQLRPRWSVYQGPGHHGQGRRTLDAWTKTGSTVVVHGDAHGNTGGMSADWAGSDRKYQRVEVRMRTTARESRYHPVLILWPEDGYKRGKCDGEVDFSESTKDKSLTHFYLHHGCDNKQTSTATKNDTTKWHNYAVEWNASHIRGFIDGKLVFSDSNASHLPPRPMHPTIQLDYFPKDGSGPLKPTDMIVDWIRVYKA